jgi:DNA invertase Pin-like site-specific DNA recombinase
MPNEKLSQLGPWKPRFTYQRTEGGMTVVGYARVSTTDQDLTIQEKALEAAGATVMFWEQKSGTTTNNRTELRRALNYLRRGDVLLITRIDRLARSLRDLQNILHELKDKGAGLKATEQPIDTSTSAGKCFLDMLGVFAEFENNLRRERQREGIAKAKALGKYTGRPRTLPVEKIREMYAAGLGAAYIAKQLKIHRSSVYRALEET